MMAHFDALAPLYDRLIGPPDPTHLRALLDLPTTGWVLDAGGGTGRVAAQLRALAGNLVLLDRSQPMLRRAQGKGLWPIQSDVAHLPFPDACFDRVVVVDALHHFADQQATIGEAAAGAQARRPAGDRGARHYALRGQARRAGGTAGADGQLVLHAGRDLRHGGGA